MRNFVRYIRAVRQYLVKELGLDIVAARDVFLRVTTLSAISRLDSSVSAIAGMNGGWSAFERRIGTEPVFIRSAARHESVLKTSTQWLPADVVAMIAKEPTLLGWAFQVWNEAERDQFTWGVSRKGDGRISRHPVSATTQIFTEAYMASFLVDRCSVLTEGARKLDIFDPACGAGHMLVAAFRRCIQDDRHSTDASRAVKILQGLHGCDIDPCVVEVCRTVVILEAMRCSAVEPCQAWDIISRNIFEVASPHGTLDRHIECLPPQRVFDWVITNPPYIGRRKLSEEMRLFLDTEYPAASMDLCAAFMCRCIELLAPSGALGLVTNDKWLRLRGYESLRTGGEQFEGIYRSLSLDVVCELGQRAFSPLSSLHDGVGTALLTARKEYPPSGHSFLFVSCVAEKTLDGKAKVLTESSDASEHRRPVAQSELTEKGASCTFISQHGLPHALANSGVSVRDRAVVVVGLQTNNDRKFVRHIWSVPPDPNRWIVHSKGGGYGRWYGMNRFVLDWSGGEASFNSSRHGARGLKRWFSEVGWTYTWFANGALGLRRKEREWSFGRAASTAVFPDDDRVIGVLNSRVGSLAARRVGGKAQLPEGVVRSLPLPVSFEAISLQLIEAAVELKKIIVSTDLTEVSYCPHVDLDFDYLCRVQAILLLIEGALERQVIRACAMHRAEQDSIDAWFGRPVAWNERVARDGDEVVWAALPKELEGVRDIVEQELCSTHSRHVVNVNEKVRLYVEDGAKIVAGPGSLPTTSFLEGLCRSAELHPLDAVSFVTSRDGSNVRVRQCLERPLLQGRIVREVLRALGHQWWSTTRGYDPSLHQTLSVSQLADIVARRLEPLDVHEALGEDLRVWISSKMERWHTKLFHNAPLIVRISGTNGHDFVFAHAWSREDVSTACDIPENRVEGSL